MLNARRMTLLILGILLSATGFADDAKPSNFDAEPLPAITLNVEALLADSWYLSRWQLTYPIEVTASSDDWRQPTAEFNFRQDSVLGRVSELRNLSLLTFAKIGRANLFFGVNEDGLIGLHFNAIPRGGDERYLELIRMPYLKENTADSDVE